MMNIFFHQLFFGSVRLKFTTHPSNANMLPPALPEAEWAGKSQLNYTTLHEKLAEPIACLRIPVGVLGFYIYLTQHIVSCVSIYLAIRSIEKLEKAPSSKGSRLGFIGSSLAFAFSLKLLVDSCQTAHKCSLKHGKLGVANLMGIIWSSLTQLASLLGLLGSAPFFSSDTRYGWWIFAILAYGMSFSLNLFPGITLSIGILNEGGIIRPHTNSLRWLDSVKLNATLVSLIPAMMLAVVLMCWGVMYYWQTADGARSTTVRVVTYTFVSLGYEFFLLWTGASYVSLGKIFGSPWGTWWVVEKTGKLYAAWIAIFSSLFILLGFGGVLSGSGG
ncbi:hypothetical protein BCR34DRAFT_176826 [Clohesyomyces aquaticus]|uniref:Uncharacterized protein n=1 Tax=Clohesyomyces aquaticus TaxID=1231657 RepID=A0A1Y1YFK1_9PLEO|nr:hypothetical protein BCR34DRAFT_176826 [Clohesyomyces aquaticus]